MSQLKDDLVASSNTYLWSMKEQTSFFYPSLDLGMLYIFNIICDFQLVDDEEGSPSEHIGSPSIAGTRGGLDGDETEGGDSATPRQEEVLVEGGSLEDGQ